VDKLSTKTIDFCKVFATLKVILTKKTLMRSVRIGGFFFLGKLQKRTLIVNIGDPYSCSLEQD